MCFYRILDELEVWKMFPWFEKLGGYGGINILISVYGIVEYR